MTSPLFVLGIGASAGGLKALQPFLEALEPQLDAAIVVIMHLAPDQTSQLQEVIQNWTQIPVVDVTENTLLQSQNIYLISPNTWLECQGEFLIPHDLNQHRIDDPIGRLGVRVEAGQLKRGGCVKAETFCKERGLGPSVWFHP